METQEVGSLGVEVGFPIVPQHLYQASLKATLRKLRQPSRKDRTILAGFSGGATIAYEISQLLRHGGGEVANLVILDGCPCYGGTGVLVKKWVARHLLESMNLYSRIPEAHRETTLKKTSRRLYSSTKLDEITLNQASLERYDGPIVISGISGRFPGAVSHKELNDKLLNGEELTSETKTRWDNPMLPKRFGFLGCLNHFDATFFGQTPRQAHQTDPQMRLLLEAVFEAMIDAGMSPTGMRGSRTAVFSGAYGGEAVDYSVYQGNKDNAGYLGLTSTSFMIPGRIAFNLDLQGPSSQMCTACSSSFTALESAVHCITLGKCDAAIVTGSTVHLSPEGCMDLVALRALADDGRCKTFDQKADGFTRSEAAVAILIQKEKDAKRNYAKILSIRSNTDGFKYEGILFPSRITQERLLKESYAQAGIDPAKVSYLETHGTGTPMGDTEELQAVHNTFCKGTKREKPLLIGSVKTNIGHTEGGAGLCGVSKVIGAIQTGTIPKHLWFEKPKAEDEHVFDGSFEITTEPTPFDRGIVGISSFGIGGTNYHLILEPGQVHQELPQHDLPILIPFSGRSTEQVEESIKEAAQSARNPEFTYLLHNAFQRDISGHSARGFGLLEPGKTEPTVSVQNYNSAIRPVWIIFPGMGSQWNEMGKDLLTIEPFAESFNRSRQTLKNLGVDLDQLLKAGNEAIFNDIHMAVLSITAMQMALYDTIMELGLTPEGFIGHSTGEFLCAYADGCFTAEETLLVTDARGRAFKESQKVVGGMASIGLSWEEVKERLPADLELACHNAAQNVTVSGPAESVTKFVQELKKEEKFAVVVNSCGIAAHSRHVQDAADLLKKYVADIIKGERPRSSRWISTSISETEWDSPMAKCASPEYFDNNLRAPVLFYEALQHVPSKSLVVEVSPKGFFQALLKETVPNDCVHVAPMTLKSEDKLKHFFQSVGQMYTSGVDVQVDKLYPAVTLPVSSNTPSVAHLIKWNHETAWKDSVIHYPLDSGSETEFDLTLPLYSKFVGHKIENRLFLPATAYIMLAWINYTYKLGQHYEGVPVVLTNLCLKRATILQEKRNTKVFSVVVTSSGSFQFQNEGDIIANGNITRLPEGESVWPELPQVPNSDYLPLSKDDAYKEFRLRGYNYSGAYQGIQQIDNEGRWSEVAWTGDWASFLDTVLQTSLLCTTDRHLAVPIDFERITIDPIEFKKHLKDPPEGQEHPVVRVVTLPNLRKIVAPGIEFKGLQPTIMPRKGQRGNLALDKFTFCPFIETSTQEIEPYVSEMVDLVLDNCRTKDLKVLDIFTNKDNSLAKLYNQILSLKPMQQSDVRMLTLATEADKMDDKEKKAGKLTTKETKEELVPELAGDLVMLDDAALLQSIIPSVKPSGFIFLHSETTANEVKDVELISQKTLESKTLSLYRKMNKTEHKIIQVPVDAEGFSWITELQEALTKPTEEASRIYVTSQHKPSSGVLGLVSCLRQEEDGEGRIRSIFDPQGTLNLDFTNPDKKLSEIVTKDLASITVKDNKIGTYRHIPLEAETNGVTKNVERAYVSTLIPGDLSRLRWIESPLVNYKAPAVSEGKEPTEKLYKVAYAAMNFRDVLLATGTIPIQPQFSYKSEYLGFEFSGYDDKGNRVMGITHGKGLATSVVCDPRFVWNVPEEWTLEQAATVPVVYGTVLYAFHTRGKIRAGQTVLIHAGSGGVGQAAISIALAQGCTVLTTVGTPEKREFIKKTFPQIKDEHIGNSRDTSFEDQFMSLTNGRGVDVVLNSLAGDKLHATLRCLAVNGKFLEIGVFDAFMNTPVGLRPFLNNIEFHGITLYHILGEDLAYEAEMKQRLEDGIKSGAIRPLNAHVFERDQVEEAFRFMATGKHTGKLLLKVRDESNWEEHLNLPAVGRSYFSADKAYVIVGGLGGLGLEVANWLVERGARRLVLTSRSGLTTGYQSLCLRKWQQLGVVVDTPALDLSDSQVAESFLSELAKNHTIGGIFNSALVLKDEAFPNQTIESFREVAAPKADVTQILDVLSRKYCPNLDWFVVFSSFACGRGNADQTNYGWANSVMERICENRKADGLHGLAIQWGVVGQVGLVAEKLFKNMDDNTELMGTLPQNVDSCLEVLDYALQQNVTVASSVIVAEKGNKRLDRAGLLERMQTIFGIKDIDSLSPDKKLSEIGMDSLVAVELKQTLEREYDMIVTKELLLSLTVGDLKEMDAGTFDPSRVGKVAGGKLGNGEVYVPFKLYSESLVKLKSSQRKLPIFLIHGLEGNAEIFKPLTNRVDAEFYGFQFTHECNASSILSVAQSYLNDLKEVEPVGPYVIIGFSGGCTIAYEIVQLLLKNGDEVTQLILLDGCPSYAGTGDGVKKTVALNLLQSRGLYSKVPEEHRKKFETSLTGEIESDTKAVLDLGKEVADLQPDPQVVESYIRLGQSMVDYVPNDKYLGSVTLIQAMDESTHAFGAPNDDYNVSKYCTGPVGRFQVKGDHWTFLSEDNVAETADILIKLLPTDPSSEKIH